MITKQSTVVLCALLSVSAAQAWHITAFNATPYTAEICAGRAGGGSTVKVVALPQTIVELPMGEYLNDSVYAYISIPDATGKSFTTKETKQHYSSSGQRTYKEFIIYGPVNGEFYAARPVF